MTKIKTVLLSATFLLICCNSDAGKNPDDYKKFKELTAQAEKGDHHSQALLSGVYRRGDLGQAVDYQQAAKWAAKSAEGKDPLGMFYLGVIQENGLGVKRDPRLALENYILAFNGLLRRAGEGDTEAQYSLGYMYENEKGVKKDNQEALKWFKTAAEKGHVRAQVYLGRIYTQQQNLDEAAKWLEKAASKGHIESKFLLGLILLRQEKSPGDTINAVKLISFAAASGNADAQYVFGTLLESGKGISRNPGMAFEWYRKASLQGHKKAEKRFKEMIKILKVKTTGGTKNE